MSKYDEEKQKRYCPFLDKECLKEGCELYQINSCSLRLISFTLGSLVHELSMTGEALKAGLRARKEEGES